jgi:hypothetical protein
LLLLIGGFFRGLDISLSVFSLLRFLISHLWLCLFSLTLSEEFELLYGLRFFGLEGFPRLCVILSFKLVGQAAQQLESCVDIRHLVLFLVGKAAVFAVVTFRDRVVRH